MGYRGDRRFPHPRTSGLPSEDNADERLRRQEIAGRTNGNSANRTTSTAVAAQRGVLAATPSSTRWEAGEESMAMNTFIESLLPRCGVSQVYTAGQALPQSQRSFGTAVIPVTARCGGYHRKLDVNQGDSRV